MWERNRVLFALLAAGALMLAACGGAPAAPPGPTPFPEGTVGVVVQSSNTKELWMDRMVEQFNAAENTLSGGEKVVVAIHHTGSGLKEDLEPTLWSPANQVYIDDVNQEAEDLGNEPLVTGNCPGTIRLPIGIAMWEPMAEALGWPDEPVHWQDIIDLALDPEGWASLGQSQWGMFRYGHGHPARSNSGRLSIVAEIYAALGKTEGLTYDEVWQEDVQEAVGAVQQAVQHYGPIDTALLDKMVVRGPQYLHAVTNYEGNVIRWNQEYGPESDAETKLRFPLVLVYPADGTFWMDHPICILDGAEWVTEEHVEAAEMFRDFILEEAQQAQLPETGLRPALEGIPLDGEGSLLTLENGVNPEITPEDVPVLAYPPENVMDAVVEMWYQVKKPSTVLMIIDVSGSMEGDKLANAREAAQEFVRQMRPRDEIIAMAFSDNIRELSAAGQVGAVQEELLPQIAGLRAGGGTALYQVTAQGFARIEGMRQTNLEAEEETRRIYGIVLMTDGEDSGGSMSEQQMFGTLPDGTESTQVRIYTIAYGDDAKADVLRRIAERTNGRFFMGGTEDIQAIYNEISSEF